MNTPEVSNKMTDQLQASLEELLEASQTPDTDVYFMATMRFAATAIAAYTKCTGEQVGSLDSALVGKFPELEYSRDVLHGFIQQDPVRRAGLFHNWLLVEPEEYEANATWNRDLIRSIFGAIKLDRAGLDLVEVVEAGKLTLYFGAHGSK